MPLAALPGGHSQGQGRKWGSDLPGSSCLASVPWAEAAAVTQPSETDGARSFIYHSGMTERENREGDTQEPRLTAAPLHRRKPPCAPQDQTTPPHDP